MATTYTPHDIRVEISGAPRAGKTTIALIIADALHGAGVPIRIEDWIEPRPPGLQERCVEVVVERAPVVLIREQATPPCRGR